MAVKARVTTSGTSAFERKGGTMWRPAVVPLVRRVDDGFRTGPGNGERRTRREGPTCG